MQTATRHVVRCLVALATIVSAASVPAQQAPADDAGQHTVPVALALTKECGADRNEALPDVATQSYAWCRDAVTRLDGSIEPGPALTGRLLTVAADVDAASGQVVPVQLVVMTFDAAWKPLTQRRAALSGAQGQLAARIYVPADTRRIGLTLSGLPLSGLPLSGSADARTLLHIRRVTARPGERPVAPGTMCVPCKAYLDAAFEQVRTHFLFIDHLPMDDVAQALRLDATGAASVAELDDVLKQLASRMNGAERAVGAARVIPLVRQPHAGRPGRLYPPARLLQPGPRRIAGLCAGFARRRNPPALLGTGDLGYLVDAANGSAGTPLLAEPAPPFDVSGHAVAVLVAA